MIPVTLHLPASALRHLRELAAVLLSRPEDMETEPVRQARFDELLRYAVAESMLTHASYEPLAAPHTTLAPMLTVHASVPLEAVTFVAHLAGRSGLRRNDAWRAILCEFCQREAGPSRSLTLAA